MLLNKSLTEDQATLRRYFLDFFNVEEHHRKYVTRMNECITEKKHRMTVNIDDLLEFYPTTENKEKHRSLGHELLENPNVALPLLEIAATDISSQYHPAKDKEQAHQYRRLRVSLRGSVGSVITPRDLRAQCAKRMICVSGIVTRVSVPKCRVVESAHFCSTTSRFSKRGYRDSLSSALENDMLPAINVMPQKDNAGNLLRTEFGLSTFQDIQSFTLQESPENTPPGQLPRSIEVRADDDLVDSVKSGDRVNVLGVYQPYVQNKIGKKDFDTVLLANDVTLQSTEKSTLPVEDEVVLMRTIAAKPNVLDILAESVAPSVHGRLDEKKGIILMLVGGVERTSRDTHIRGDINVLMVGEPATAKSQLMRFVYHLAPKAVHTTGRGSTGVGLTAAVISDPDTRERSLCAGAMVLADRGVLLIDEFDKMSGHDRVAMHEAMEQQTITIAKAGIHASINARCSVLAAANPIYGYYATGSSLGSNLGLPDSLLSRFDLTFLILDTHSEGHTRMLSQHVLKNHMTATPMLADERKKYTESNPHEISNPWGKSSLMSVSFLRKYITLAKHIEPTLSPAAVATVSDLYAELRRDQAKSAQVSQDNSLHVSPRTLEALIRLSTAHAKLRLDKTVEVSDVHIAYTLVKQCVYATVEAQKHRDSEIDDWKASTTGAQTSASRRTNTAEPHEAETVDFSGATIPSQVTADITNTLLRLQEASGRNEFKVHEIHAALENKEIGIEQLTRALQEIQALGDIILSQTPGGDIVTIL
ncbi:minichromosome maintenance (MCM) complex subunit [Perkinsela sp. CCAP 1560/4]|nr:minichromosome maintenance (MCM) complex subunit [Perkinsela sp. CCAP 1560/4]|eukprot:KNH08372.1 minichromosome maintenance (MCM) complex subunit [Perkinsela sp. CCAP 1560/4]